MMRPARGQLDLFGTPRSAREQYDAPGPRDPNVTETEELRLKGQNLRILERLQEGPASNKELAQISLKYTSRISDLRAKGFIIPPPIEDEETGEAMYRLINKGA